MDNTHSCSSDVAFTPTIKAVQARKGLRPAHRHIEERGGWRTAITPDLAAFIAAQTSVFLASDPLVTSLSGRYFERMRPAQPTKDARDAKLAAKLWTVSERLTGLALDAAKG